MSAANFCAVNASDYYVINGYYTAEDEEGNEQEYVFESWDWDDLMDNIAYNVKQKFGDYDRINGGDHNRSYYGANICESDARTFGFGKKQPWFLNVNLTNTIMLRSGYYSGANLDYEVKVETENDTFCLSDYSDLGDLIDDIFESLEYMVSEYGYEEGWNVGTFKMQWKNIEKWLTDTITEQIEECETICEENCDNHLVCVGRFSNGEAVYEKADSIRGIVNRQ